MGTAGSFFKNPVISHKQYACIAKMYPELPYYPHGNRVKVSAAWLLDKVANYKGIIDGAVGTYHAQALVFITNGQATADELEIFAKKISKIIFAKTGIRLEREVCFVGEK